MAFRESSYDFPYRDFSLVSARELRYRVVCAVLSPDVFAAESSDIKMSFPAARLETRIQEFVMYGSAIPVPTIGTVLIPLRGIPCSGVEFCR